MPDIGLVENSKIVLGKFAQYHQNPLFSDITLIIDETKFVSHRFVLGANSKFFEILLSDLNYKEAVQNEITIKAPLDAFRVLNEYMYKGNLDLRVIELKIVIELLELCHRYGIYELEKDIVKYLNVVINVPNAVKGLELSHLMGHKRIEELCWTLIELSIEGLVEEITLTYEVLAELVFNRTRRVTEQNLKDFIIKSTNDENFCSDEERIELLAAVKDKKLEPFNELRDITPESSEDYQKLAKVFAEEGAEFFFSKGKNHAKLFPDSLQKFFCVEFDQIYTFNHIIFNNHWLYEYLIQISIDGDSWEQIFDSKTYFKGIQNLYFPLTRAKFIKIVAKNIHHGFEVNSFQILYEKNPPKFFSGFIIPTDNIFIQNHVVVNEIPGDISNTNFVDLGVGTSYYSWKNSEGPIEIFIEQPYILSSLRFRLWDFDGQKYSYVVEVISDEKFEVISDKSDEECDGWQTIHFAPRVVREIIIQGVAATEGDEIRIAHFECPALGEKK